MVALLLVVVITVIAAVLIHKRQQQKETVTMEQVATLMNTIDNLKEDGIYGKIDDCLENEKDTSLQETKVKPQSLTKETKSLPPIMMKVNVVN